LSDKTLTVRQIADVPVENLAQKWLVKDLWGQESVGIVGGPPKCCKSWLGLDLALSVASGTPCLGHFQVVRKGPALVYLAEDAASMVRERIQGICESRRLLIENLDLHIIDTPSLRLDLDSDRTRLVNSIDILRPRLLLLDPLVRLHRADENSSADISAILGFLRELQRRFKMSVILVHHMSKKLRAQLGQALRGSGDLHAFGDCNAYLVRKSDKLILSVEHRFAPSSKPLQLALVSDDLGNKTHLEIINFQDDNSTIPITENLRLALANADKPLTRVALRSLLRVNNHRLGLALKDLEQKHLAIRKPAGWVLNPNRPASSDSQLSLV
jgi:hypothetical protein